MVLTDAGDSVAERAGHAGSSPLGRRRGASVAATLDVGNPAAFDPLENRAGGLELQGRPVLIAAGAEGVGETGPRQRRLVGRPDLAPKPRPRRRTAQRPPDRPPRGAPFREQASRRRPAPCSQTARPPESTPRRPNARGPCRLPRSRSRPAPRAVAPAGGRCPADSPWTAPLHGRGRTRSVGASVRGPSVRGSSLTRRASKQWPWVWPGVSRRRRSCECP
jgi:hypothetical protein